MLRVSAEGMLPLAVARWVIEGSYGLAAFIAADELTFEGLLAALHLRRPRAPRAAPVTGARAREVDVPCPTLPGRHPFPILGECSLSPKLKPPRSVPPSTRAANSQPR
jgi:hypothetical protein